MKEKRLINDGSVCEGDFVDGIDTVAELNANRGSRERCRYFPHECPALKDDIGPYCIPATAVMVARFALKRGQSVDQELVQFKREAPMPSNGYFDPTIEDLDSGTTDMGEVGARVKVWAARVMGIQEVDSTSVNREYKNTPSERLLGSYPVLESSVFDEETSTWLHECGSVITTAEINHPIWFKHGPGPTAGTGKVKVENRPFCPTCQEEPKPSGTPLYAEDLEREENEILRRMRDA